MANRVDKSHWSHDCGDQADVTAVIVMTQPADLPMLSREGKSFRGRVYREGETTAIHETIEFRSVDDAEVAVDRWLEQHTAV